MLTSHVDITCGYDTLTLLKAIRHPDANAQAFTRVNDNGQCSHVDIK